MSTSLAASTCLATVIGKTLFGDGTVSETCGALKHRTSVGQTFVLKI